MSTEKRLKINLELHVVGDGRTFLNYWNHRNGEDVIAQVKDGKLYMRKDMDSDFEVESGLQDFIGAVKSKF